MTDRKKPGVAFWATVVVVCMMLYVASFGPACWVSPYVQPSGDLISAIYCPVLMLCSWGPDWLADLIVDYAGAWETNAGIYMRGSRVCIEFE